MIKIGCISDLHGRIDGYTSTYRGIEFLIIAGDICPIDNVRDQEVWLKESINKFINKDIFPDLQELIIVPGNHDFWLEKNYENFLAIRKIFGYDFSTTVLVDQGKEFVSFLSGESVYIYGNPRTSLYTFAFPHLSGNEDISKISKCDILVTHEAPRVFELPCIKNSQGAYGKNDEPGNLSLKLRLEEIKPKYHIFGHIHYPCSLLWNNINLINVSQYYREKYVPSINIIEWENLTDT